MAPEVPERVLRTYVNPRAVKICSAFKRLTPADKLSVIQKRLMVCDAVTDAPVTGADGCGRLRSRALVSTTHQPYSWVSGDAPPLAEEARA